MGLAGGELLDAVRVHVVADDTVTHLCGAYSQWKPDVALTCDNDLHGSSYSIAVLEWTLVLVWQGEVLCLWCLS
ncbi:hypothetical protein GCM10010218_13090 [Streptomyces mashuensis]|uniref:Uncharacterized protein n=1 Tax=Streptomyces mashuensis TaxID=33904 RepID=A0A919AZ16_9ACTN|nr:hypothetical protein GCM10010218_13090 [Streptomyces mashuensis]